MIRDSNPANMGKLYNYPYEWEWQEMTSVSKTGSDTSEKKTQLYYHVFSCRLNAYRYHCAWW